MVATPPYAAALFAVRVIPFEGQWCVACKKGYYALPVEKTAAVEWAKRLAMESGLSEIAICDLNDTVTDVLKVTAP